MCEAGEFKTRSKITWLSLTFRHDSHELGTRPSKDEQESHRDVIGKLCPPIEILVISDVHINGVELKCGSCITHNQL
jgi:hypothetical protein